MSTSTNFRLRSFFSALFSLLLVGAISASTNLVSLTDSCSAEIIVTYDSLGQYAVLQVEHSGTPNSTMVWSDSSETATITVNNSGSYCVTVYTETQCAVTKCVSIDIGAGANCEAYIVKEPLSEGGYMLIVETNDPHGNTSYTWSDGTHDNSIIVNQTGQYCVDVMSSYGCPTQACIHVDVPVQNDSCAVTVFSYPDTIYGGAYVSVDPSGIAPFAYQWTNGSTTSGIEVTVAGEYCVTVTDGEGCVGIGCQFVEVAPPNHSVTFTVPVDITTYSDANCHTEISILVTGDASDEYTTCGSGYQATYTDHVTDYCQGSFVINRTWVLNDDCGNSETQLQVITVLDTLAPSIQAPAHITLFMDANCWADTSIANLGMATAYDNCSPNTPVTYTDQILPVPSNGTCGGDIEILRTWTAFDDCGNQSSEIQIIILEEPADVDSCFIDVTIFEIERNIDVVKLGVDPTGVAPFTYTWSNGSTAEYLYAQEEGTYCLTVTDGNGCEGYQCQTVEFESTPVDSCYTWIEQIPQADGTVKVWAHSEGVGAQVYTWAHDAVGTASEPYFYTSESGSYCVTVFDANQCSSTACIDVVIAPTEPDTCASWIVKTPEGDHRYKLRVETEGVGPFTLVWHDSLYQDGDYLYVEESGYYCATVYDANQCESNACIDIVIDPTVDSCFMDVTIFEIERNIDVVKLGVDPAGVAPFTYTWSNGSTAEYLYAQEEGTYCLTVTDGNGCEGYQCQTVEFETSPVDTCYTWIEQIPQADGTVKVWAHSEGVGAQVYTWANDPTGAASESYLYISESGNYCVTVFDANQCSSTACIDVVINPTTDSCFMDVTIFEIERTIDFVKLGADPAGVTPFTYSWSDGSATEHLYAQEEGTYCLTITDGNGCEGYQCQTVEFEPAPVDSCYTWMEQIPQADGTVKVWAHSEGVGAQVYTWAHDAAGTASEPYFYTSESGSYCVTVFDANQCSSTACIDVVINPTTDSCFIDVTIFEIERTLDFVKLGADPAGVTPFTYTWSNGSTAEYLYAQEEGTYCLTVTDGNGCEGYQCQTVEFESTPVDSCYTWIEQIPQADGTVKVWAHSEGVGAQVYTWAHDAAGIASEPYFYTSESGSYCVTVFDANQCSSTACIDVVIAPTEPDTCASWIVKTPEGDHRYKLRVETEGVGPFTIVWQDSLYQDGDYLYVEESGYYCATVYDANQCVSNACIDIVIDATTEPNDSCWVYLLPTIYAADFVAEVVAEPSGVGPFSYQWSNGTSGNAIELHESQDVCVTVTDVTGCTATHCIGVDVPERPCSLQIIRSDNSTDNQVILEALAEGEGDMTYQWSTEGTDEYLVVSESGEYCVTITAANGCTKSECVFIDINNVVCETEIEINPISSDYEVILDAAPSGDGPFTFAWSNGDSSSSIVVLESGSYCVVVVDSRGCVSEYCKEITIAIPECESEIKVEEERDDEVTISVETEGKAPFAYYWSTGENTKEITVTESKEYAVDVVDALGCISHAYKYIQVVDYSECSVEIEVIANADSTEYKVIANPSGTAPFTYKWGHGDTTRYFYPELDGYFCVTVTDAEGCVSETCFETEGITPSVELEAFPNPAVGNFFVEIDSELEFKALVEIRDIKGNLLFTTSVDVEEGVQGLNFDSDDYPAGVFFVNIIRGSHVESIRVVKANGN